MEHKLQHILLHILLLKTVYKFKIVICFTILLFINDIKKKSLQVTQIKKHFACNVKLLWIFLLLGVHWASVVEVGPLGVAVM